MKRIDWQQIKTTAISTMRAFPVEIILSLCYFVVIVIENESWGDYHEEVENMLAFMPVCWILSFTLNRLLTQARHRRFYHLSLLLAVATPFIYIEAFSMTYGMIWILAAAVLLAGSKQKDNRLFTIDNVRIPFHIASSGLLSLSISLLLMGIYASFIYIFDLEVLRRSNIYTYLFLFPITVVAPFLFCLFQNKERSEKDWQATRFFKILNNWILSPALIIYTFILYLYGFKILFTWDLPKGMLSYMISAFLCIAVIARACQTLLDKRHYDWYYKHLSLIAIPILALFWIGIIYRIREYGFTEGRVFLLLLSVLLTIITFMDFFRSKFNYLYFCILTILVIAPVTLIPPIQAKQLGLISQENRLNRTIDQLNLRDPETGLIRHADIPETLRDSTSARLYNEMIEGFRYVYRHTEGDYMQVHYGHASISELQSALFKGDLPGYIRSNSRNDYIYHQRSNNTILSIEKYKELYDFYVSTNIRNDSLMIERDTTLITSFAIKNFLSERPVLLHDNADQDEVDRVLLLENDSCLAIIDYISIDGSRIKNISVKYLLKK